MAPMSLLFIAAGISSYGQRGLFGTSSQQWEGGRLLRAGTCRTLPATGRDRAFCGMRSGRQSRYSAGALSQWSDCPIRGDCSPCAFAGRYETESEWRKGEEPLRFLTMADARSRVSVGKMLTFQA